jgi:hypothetical protein
VAAEAEARIETQQRWGARTHHFECAPGHFLLQTSAAERTNRCAILANEHARPGPPVTRSLRANERCQRERLFAMAFPFPDDIADFSHYVGFRNGGFTNRRKRF